MLMGGTERLFPVQASVGFKSLGTREGFRLTRTSVKVLIHTSKVCLIRWLLAHAFHITRYRLDQVGSLARHAKVYGSVLHRKPIGMPISRL